MPIVRVETLQENTVQPRQWLLSETVEEGLHSVSDTLIILVEIFKVVITISDIIDLNVAATLELDHQLLLTVQDSIGHNV